MDIRHPMGLRHPVLVPLTPNTLERVSRERVRGLSFNPLNTQSHYSLDTFFTICLIFIPLTTSLKYYEWIHMAPLIRCHTLRCSAAVLHVESLTESIDEIRREY